MSEPSASPVILLVLTVVTGIVDAVSFLAIGHVFTANMTGNIVLLGFALAGASRVSIPRSSVSLLAFLGGAIVGGRMTLHFSSRRWVSYAFRAEAFLLAVCSASSLFNPLQPYAVIALTAVAMGLRNAVVPKLGVPDLTTTVLTLTVAALASDSGIAGGDNPRWQWRVAAIVAMLAGAAAGARMVTRSIWFPLAVCSAITAACAFAQMHINSKRTVL